MIHCQQVRTRAFQLLFQVGPMSSDERNWTGSKMGCVEAAPSVNVHTASNLSVSLKIPAMIPCVVNHYNCWVDVRIFD